MLKTKNGYKASKTHEYLLRRFRNIKSRHFESKFTLDQYNWLYKKTIEYAPADLPCLDWGCGHGHFSLFLQENHFLDVYGCAFEDPSVCLLDISLYFSIAFALTFCGAFIKHMRFSYDISSSLKFIIFFEY